MAQIIANILFVLIPMYYLVRKNSSMRTKKIAGVILIIVILGLIGEFGAKLSGSH